jgi:hypothetical protein
MRPETVPDVPPGSVRPVTCPVMAEPPKGVAEKVYLLIVAPPLVDGGTKEIPMEVAVREVTASVPGVANIVETSIVAAGVFGKSDPPSPFPTTDKIYLVPADKVEGDVIVRVKFPMNSRCLSVIPPTIFPVPVIAVPPETGVKL